MWEDEIEPLLRNDPTGKLKATVFIAHYSLPKIIQLETSRDHRRRQSADSSRVASALEFVLADNTKRVHAGQWL